MKTFERKKSYLVVRDHHIAFSLDWTHPAYMCWLQWFCSCNTRCIYLSIERQSQNSNHQVAPHNLEAVLGMEHSSYPCYCTNFVCIHLFEKKKYNTLLISKALQMYENGSILIFNLHGPFGSGLDLQFTAVKFEQICFSVE